MPERSVRVKITANVSDFNRAMASAGRAASDLSDRMERAETQGKLLRDSILALAPAIVPVTTAAVPAIAGLSVSLSAAAVAAGTAALAFAGIGKGLTALNAYQLDPTAANLQTLQDTLRGMAPAGREFVQFLDGLQAPLDQLQRTAQAGFLPGLQAGINDALTQLPIVQRLVGSVADVMGRLSQEAGSALSGPFWTQFLRFLADTTGPALDTLGRTLGNVATGVAAVFQAFTPLGTDFNNALLGMSRSFSTWAQSLSDSGGFQDFVSYIRETGPQVVDTLGSLANALIQIGEAAAPVGRVMVPAIGALADVLAALADSPAGPALVAAAAGVGVLNRAIATFNAVKASSIVTTLGGGAGGSAAVGFGKAAAGAVSLGVALDGLSRPAGSAVGALELVAGGAGIGALVGGPVGAGVGAAVGGLTALGKALLSTGDDAETTVPKIESFIDTLDQVTGAATDATRSQAAANLENFKASIDGVRESALQLAQQNGIKGSTLVDAIVGSPADMQAAQAQIDAALKSLEVQRQAQMDILAGIRMGDRNAVPATLRQINDQEAALKRLGGFLDNNRGKLAGNEQQFRRLAEATNGATSATRADSAATLINIGIHNKQADALLGTIGGWIGFRDAVRTATAGAKGFTGSIFAQTKAADEQKAALAGVATQWNGLSVRAQNASGAYRSARQQFLSVADAMNVSKSRAKELADTWLDLPTDVRTKATADTSAASANARALQRDYNALPKDVRTDLAANGVPATATVNSLMAKYEGLSRADATTILRANDLATGTIQSVQLRLSQLNGYTATTYIRTVATGGSRASGVQVQGADGMVIDYYGAGGVREKHLAQIAPAGAMRVWAEPETGGEAYIPLDAAKRGRSVDIWREVGQRLGVTFAEYATGGVNAGTAPSASRQHDVIARLIEQFGRNSPIVQAIQTWLDGLAKNEFTQRALVARIDQAVTRQQQVTGTAVGRAFNQFGFRPNADAGTVSSELRTLYGALRDAVGKDSPLLAHIRDLGDALMTEAKKRDDLREALTKQTDVLRNLQQKQTEYAATVAGNFTTDPFANNTTLGGVLRSLNADTANATRFDRLGRRARRLGLSGPALKAILASGNAGVLSDIDTRREAQRLEEAWRQRARATSALGDFAGTTVYGDAVREQTRQVVAMRHDLDVMRREIVAMGDRVESGAAAGTRDGFDRNQRRRRNHVVRAAAQ